MIDMVFEPILVVETFYSVRRSPFYFFCNSAFIRDEIKKAIIIMIMIIIIMIKLLHMTNPSSSCFSQEEEPKEKKFRHFFYVE